MNNAAQSEYAETVSRRYARLMRELQSDLRDLVESGELTDIEANEYANYKAEQWAFEQQ